ncbi:DUF4097 family beta strand repeat-containing protein [Larkinella terrae]|uniref:DUF4097 family beta strand repeat protein n=1 Tax=Larkinella terrae TaxID=2025311 RepID=A0A7K0EJ95_9BACT|nr:DUF4097 family beta strand repeat-containing protein [Larkinella terrae]MRS61526.1 DUF4097 family beta strand repeat protein [Larkinella terrae]
MRTLFFLLAFVTLSAFAAAQTRLQVVTKTVEKELTYSTGQRVNLTAQKADITIKGWNKSTVLVRLKLIAKHPEREVAERELGYLNYDIQTRNNVIDLSNRFTIPQRAGAIKGNLKAVYEVWVPTRCPVSVRNTFGDVSLSDLASEASIQLEFGKLSVANLSGKTTVISDYGDIDASELSGFFTIKAEKADITLRELSGSGTIQSRYGKLSIQPDASLTSLSVQAARTEVFLYPKRLDDFQYEVETTNAIIRVPDAYGDSLDANKRRFTYSASSHKPTLLIKNSYSPVVIQLAAGGITLAK